MLTGWLCRLVKDLKNIWCQATDPCWHLWICFLVFKFNFFELFYIIINHSFIWPLLITCREVVCRRYAHKRYLLTRGRATKTMGRQLRSWDSWGNLMLSIKNWKSAYFSYRACKEHSHNTIFWLEFPENLSLNHMLSLTECVWNLQNNALWDTH